MRTVIMRLPPEADFSSEMAGMREWLDKHRCAPSRFEYDLAQEGVIISVEFNREEEVAVFKRYLTEGKASWLIPNRCKLRETAE
jgi:hypothetical protein